MVEAPRYVQLSKGGLVLFGGLAATDVAHGFVPDGNTGTLCLACSGWCNDFRHLGGPTGKGNAIQASGSPGQGGGSR